MTPGDPDEPTRTTPAQGSPPQERYERIERIAAGGMGEVWRARDRVLGREVAVKVLRREYADDATFRARFEAEARHTAGVAHPGVASLYDYGVADGAPYLVMELVPGRPLSDLLAGDRPVDPDQARRLVTQAAEALGAAHARGLVHRDVKPANLLVTPDGRVKVTDFGIARAADSVPMTQTGQVLGTPHYLSPEQARGQAATAASDVYGLGVVLFECLAGHRPFTADTPVGTALAHLQQDVPELPDSVPADLRQVTRRALAKDAGERYPDGTAMAAALRGEGEDRTAVVPATRTHPSAPPPADATRVMAPGAAARRVAPPVTDAPRRRRRSVVPFWLRPAALVAALLLVLIAVVAWHPWSGGTPTPASKPRTVQVDPQDYIGRPLAQVERELRAKGLQPYSVLDSGTVSSVTPSGPVRTGTKVRVRVRYPASGSTSSAPTPTPSPSPTTSASAVPSTAVPTTVPGVTGGGSGPGGKADKGGKGSGKGKGN